MSAASWLRAAAEQPWWRDHAALAIELVIMADTSGGKPVVRTTSDMLAVRMRMSRTSLRRALDALQAAGFPLINGQHAEEVTGSIRRHIAGCPTSYGPMF